MTHARKHRRSKQAKSNLPLRWIGLVVALVVAFAGLYLAYQFANVRNNPTDSSYPLQISLDEAVAKRDAGAFILDVREPAEWADYHIPGSTLIPLGTLPDRLTELPRDREIVVVCHSGNRSARGRDILRNAGFTQVTSLSGGLLKWQDRNLPLVSG